MHTLRVSGREWVSVSDDNMFAHRGDSQPDSQFALQHNWLRSSDLCCAMLCIYILHSTPSCFDCRTIKAQCLQFMWQFFSLLLFFAHSNVVNGAWHFGPDKVLVPFKSLPNDCGMLNGTRSYWTTHIKSKQGAHKEQQRCLMFDFNHFFVYFYIFT